MDNKTKGLKIRELKRAASPAKSDLIRLSHRLSEVSPREAEKLNTIIARLEVWQNR